MLDGGVIMRQMPIPDLNAEEYCYLRTTGRVSGKPHEVEIWFAQDGDTIYILAGGGHASDWVKNTKQRPDVLVRIGGRTYSALGRVVTDGEEDARARRLLLAKYAPRNDDLDDWGRTALPVAFDLRQAEAGER